MIHAGDLKKQLKTLKDEEVLLTSAEFAKVHGYAPATIRVMISRGQISPVVKIGRDWLVPENSEITLRQRAKKSEVKLVGMAGF